jgi:protein involved in polysaccharide export with SLBB domain
MEPGRWRWCSRHTLCAVRATAHGVCLLLSLLAGCATSPKCLDKALLAHHDATAQGMNLSDRYIIHCPDALEIKVAGHPEWSGEREVTADGRIGLTETAFLRVDGQTPAEAARTVAGVAAVPMGSVAVRVADYRSQYLYLFSDVPGLQQVVPYQGPETIVDFLQRVGGMSSRCAPADIQVVRAHVADGRPPETIHVDLSAILLKQDQRTNVTLQSFDQIYIGQSRQSAVLSCFPPWLQPLYKTLCGIARREKALRQTKDLLQVDQPKRESVE